MVRVGIIFMHGLGDTPSGWASLKHQLDPVLREKLGSAASIEWEFPAAPLAGVTINGGTVMTSWFDIVDWPIGLSARDDDDGMRASVSKIHEVIAAMEARDVPAGNIVVGGFSQGGAVALNATYRYGKKLAACVCLSGWLQQKNEFEAKAKAGPNAQTPLFWGHGIFDDIVLVEQQEHGAELIKKAGVPVLAREYRTSHSSHPLEIEDLASFLLSEAWAPSSGGGGGEC
ncbi:hypothetical protein CTAYLR_001997 [Chrysophaeum taylorii]|uniref:Phospholipase/carboxylesterase/thioesterase domain-containing protein n=1 Tax=Chrysophaeum taylorii TaxID=2483200 RepID=A0AAD7U8K5_9STRA|nr:hypothetical protein CTAYLR_001997 [Chrysophaeum taylorii]